MTKIFTKFLYNFNHFSSLLFDRYYFKNETDYKLRYLKKKLDI